MAVETVALRGDAIAQPQSSRCEPGWDPGTQPPARESVRDLHLLPQVEHTEEE